MSNPETLSTKRTKTFKSSKWRVESLREITVELKLLNVKFSVKSMWNLQLHVRSRALLLICLSLYLSLFLLFIFFFVRPRRPDRRLTHWNFSESNDNKWKSWLHRQTWLARSLARKGNVCGFRNYAISGREGQTLICSWTAPWVFSNW